MSVRDQRPGTHPLSPEDWRLLVESVQDYAIFMLDPEGHVATWNRGAEAIKGYQAAEIIGSHFSRFYEPEDKATRLPERELATARAVGRVEQEGFRLRKDGTRFWATGLLMPLDGSAAGFVKIARDRTERRHAEERLRESGVKPLHREGRRDGKWVLLDFAEVVVHVMNAEERVFYSLERLWKDCPVIEFVADQSRPQA